MLDKVKIYLFKRKIKKEFSNIDISLENLMTKKEFFKIYFKQLFKEKVNKKIKLSFEDNLFKKDLNLIYLKTRYLTEKENPFVLSLQTRKSNDLEYFGLPIAIQFKKDSKIYLENKNLLEKMKVDFENELKEILSEIGLEVKLLEDKIELQTISIYKNKTKLKSKPYWYRFAFLLRIFYWYIYF